MEAGIYHRDRAAVDGGVSAEYRHLVDHQRFCAFI